MTGEWGVEGWGWGMQLFFLCSVYVLVIGDRSVEDAFVYIGLFDIPGFV
jgi:hypothetical protein